MIVMSINAQKDAATIEIRLPKSAPPTKGFWLMEASRLIWEIWPRMGWDTVSGNQILPCDWNKPLGNEKKDLIMAMIERLLKVMDNAFPEDGNSFESVIGAIASTADEIKEDDLRLIPCVEVDEFRGMVFKTLLIGVLRGLNTKSAEEMEHFGDPIYKKFFYDKTYVRACEDFVCYETKNSLVSIYTVESSCTFPSYSVHMEDNDF